jgi:transcription elongation factor GreA
MANYLTRKGLQELEAELKKIVEVDLPQTLDSLNSARQEGDLRENAGYQTAVKVKDELTARQQELEDILGNYELIDETKSSKKGAAVVQIGSEVTVVYTESKEKLNFTIVGSSESNVLTNKISNESPLAVAIMGKKAKDKVSFKAPIGKIEVEIIEVK